MYKKKEASYNTNIVVNPDTEATSQLMKKSFLWGDITLGTKDKLNKFI